jgi:hypothetical protein
LVIFWTVNDTENTGQLVFNINIGGLSTLIMAWRGVEPDKRLFWATMPNANGEPLWAGGPFDDRATLAGPSLAEFRHGLFMAWRGIIGSDGVSDRRLYYASHDGVSGWTPQTVLNDRGSNYGPALAAFRDRLYMAWRGVEDDQRLFYAVFPDGFKDPPWSDQIPLNDRASLAGPSLAVFKDQLFMAWRGVEGDQSLWWSTFDGSSWSGQCPVSPDARSLDGPSLAVLGGRLYMVWRGGTSIDQGDQRVFYSLFVGGGCFNAWSEPDVVQTPNGVLGSGSRPGLAILDQDLVIATVGLATSTVFGNPGAGDSGAGDDPGPGPGTLGDAGLYVTTFRGPGNLASVPTLISATSIQPALLLFQGPFARR